MGNCSCNRSEQGSRTRSGSRARSIDAPGFDVQAHVSCTCARDALRAAATGRDSEGCRRHSKQAEGPLEDTDNKGDAYATAGGELPAKWELRRPENALVCDDTDPLIASNRAAAFDDLDDITACLTDAGADAWHLPTEDADQGAQGTSEAQGGAKAATGKKRQGESMVVRFVDGDKSNPRLSDLIGAEAADPAKALPGLVDKVGSLKKSEQEENDDADCDAPRRVISMEELEEPSDGSDCETEQELQPMQRPRKGAVCCAGVLKATFKPPSSKKDKEISVKLRKILKECVLFKDLQLSELDAIVDTMSIDTVKKGDRLVRQGDSGDALYVIISGTVDCYREQTAPRRTTHHSHVAEEVQLTRSKTNGQLKSGAEFIQSREAGTIFGELAIMWNTPRSLSVFAKEHCTLGKLEREVYQALVVHRNVRIREQQEACLRSAKLLESLDDESIAKLADALQYEVYKKDRAIIKQGDEGKEFFIVQSGECAARIATAGDVQEHRRYAQGDFFGELALINNAKRAASIETVQRTEVLKLTRRSFERLLGPLTLLQQDSYKTDPRKIIADFYRPGDERGPWGSLNENSFAEDHLENPTSSWFAVFRPTSRDAIAKMLNGNAVGKGLNVKGKSAKKNRLSGFVPFVQISSNAHKSIIEKIPASARIPLFFRSKEARQVVFERITTVQQELSGHDRSPKRDKSEADSGTKSRGTGSMSMFHRKRGSSVVEAEVEFNEEYAPTSHGLIIPGNLLHEAYIMRPDLTPLVEWETGRKSEPAFMDMNIHAVCGDSVPRIVLFQHDEGDPMNPRGLLIAYAEKCVKPVVSDFDAFLIASKGMEYMTLPDEQAELVSWSLEGASAIMETPGSDTWTSRWLSFLKRETQRGFHPDTPKYGFGDPTSIRLIGDVVSQTSTCGAVRHGAECFNYYFPQELDDEYLIVWQDFPEKPWKYMNEQELRAFLIDRVTVDGFAFPLNPVWPVRDPGWYEVLQALRDSSATKDLLKAWYPPKSCILDKIDEIHAEYPQGFVVKSQDDHRAPSTILGKVRIRNDSDMDDTLGVDSQHSENIDKALHQLAVGTTKSEKFRRTMLTAIGHTTKGVGSFMPSMFRKKTAKSINSGANSPGTRPH